MNDEQPLIERARHGDIEAFRTLVESSKINVYRLACDILRNGADAEDAAQDVFIRAWRSLHTFRGDSKWSTWLYRITVNICLDKRKTNQVNLLEYRESMEDAAGDGPQMSAHPSPERLAHSALMGEKIEQALEKLSSQERTVFVLRHYHDLPLKEIATTLEIAEGTVKSYLFRSIRRLQALLEPYHTDPGMTQP